MPLVEEEFSAFTCIEKNIKDSVHAASKVPLEKIRLIILPTANPLYV